MHIFIFYKTKAAGAGVECVRDTPMIWVVDFPLINFFRKFFVDFVYEVLFFQLLALALS